jgi:Protein of unknown function (DUF5818)
MPLGTRHEVTGMLRSVPRGYVLEVDGGGVWALDWPWPKKAMLNQRVTVTGTRGGFDSLDVTKIKVADALQ